jgi:CBS domain-containing protein
MLAREIMNRNVATVREDAAIEEVARLLTEKNISGAPVVDSEGKVVGIVSEGDLLHKETNPRSPSYVNILGAIIYTSGLERFREDFKKLAATRASEIMTRDVISVNGDAKMEQVATLMVEHGIKRVPVLENGKIIGIITRADIIRAMAQQA